MNTPSRPGHIILTAAIIAAMLGLPGIAAAQRNRPAPAPAVPPTPGADQRSGALAPPPANAASYGAGWLGISMTEVTPDKAREARLSDVHGVVVTGVTENSPAAKVGLAGGDIIIEYEGQRVEGTLEMARLVRETPPGRTAKLSVWRDGRSREFSVEIGRDGPGNFFFGPDLQDQFNQFRRRVQPQFRFRDRAPFSGGGPAPDTPAPRSPGQQFGPRRSQPATPVLGIRVQNVSGQFGSFLKIPDGQGVLVTDVQAGSAADKGGLRAGDAIISVDGQRVRNTAELRQQIRSTTQARMLALQIVRNGAEMTLSVEVSAQARPGSRPDQRSAIPI